MSGGLSRALLIAWGTFLVGALTWPFWLVFVRPDAALATRDMMVLPHPYLTHASLGFGDLAARNVPQDAVLAVVGMVVPATFFVAIAVTATAGTAAWVGSRLGSSPWTRAAAMAVAVWNPFVVERLLQGQWSLAMVAWLLPAVAFCRGPGRVLAIWGCSLTPTGGLFALATVLLVRRSKLAMGAAVLACLPWVGATVLQVVDGAASPESAAAFAPRAEQYAGTLGALLGLGGIWNADAVPASRSTGFALAGIVLFLVLALALRRVPRGVLVLAGLGFAVPLVSWLLPGLQAWIVSHVPGGGLVRDAQKLLAFALPAYVLAAARLSRADLAGAALGLALLQVPDAPRALAVLAPVEVTVPDIDHRGRDVFFPDRPTLLTRTDGVPVVDPATKAMNVVESGALTVDGVQVDSPAPRWQVADVLFNNGTLAPDAAERAQWYFSDPQVGLVARPDGPDGHGGYVLEDTGIPARPLPRTGLILLSLWFAVPLLALLDQLRELPPRLLPRKAG
ncbi:hypothetical protein [Corynebacterium meitnerae]|uniref:Uncharacterized protein n=1 Tax=Corynebacterium meitnerae TaxID=2913498 RepID=A0A9X3LV81_9CORY|nr:hypothetical protein [Corynebacterium meitnerae]MCZ9294837.1 hypothetical protein [Corynebacterium meitnerae]